LAIDVRSTLPTKINLIRLRREYATIKRIRRVLEEKRDVLLHYIRSVADDYNKYQKEVYGTLEDMYTSFYRGEAAEGPQRTWAFASSVKESLRVKAGVTVIFTVRAPVFQLLPSTIATPAIPPGASPDLVESFIMLREELPAILRLVQYEETIRRLIEELRRTQRLINSLDYVVIPSYEKAIKFISMVLDEREREDFVRLKHLKRMLAATREAVAKAAVPQ
jgi:V/A-type H+-transporting ATPase subunit D